jgi:general secretion pathway protein H
MQLGHSLNGNRPFRILYQIKGSEEFSDDFWKKLKGFTWLRGQTGGFTLIELVVVMGLISLMVLLVIPRFPSTEEAKLRGSARALATVIKFLGDQAVATKTSFRLYISLPESRILINRIDAGGEESAAEDLFLKRSFLADGIFVQDVEQARQGKVTEGQVGVDFDSTGLREFILIHLKGSGDTCFTVAAFPQINKVKIYEGYQEAVL